MHVRFTHEKKLFPAEIVHGRNYALNRHLIFETHPNVKRSVLTLYHGFTVGIIYVIDYMRCFIDSEGFY